MCPNIFGIQNGSYTLMILLGVLIALIIFTVFLKHMKSSKIIIVDLIICVLVAIMFGIVSAILFQNLYDFIESPNTYRWSWSMTFIGGLIGGAIAFFLMYFIFYRKSHEGILEIFFTIAPGTITIAHAFGRIGCFLAGCCYGIDSNEWYAIYFPTLERKVIPTQLFEAIFLIILSSILLLLAFKKKRFSYNMPIYLLAYGIFRFMIEFIRGDHRGFTLGFMSPSQLMSILFIVIALAYFIFDFDKLIRKI